VLKCRKECNIFELTTYNIQHTTINYHVRQFIRRLERSFKILKGEGRITEINVAETLKEIRRALLDADVNYKIAKSFTDNVKQQALGQKILTSVKPAR